MAFRIQIRRDTASKWQVNNPVLLQGEMGYETDTELLKIGDGTTVWNSLPYFAVGTTGPSGPAGPAADISVYDNTTFVTGITGIQFSGGGVSVSSLGSVANVTIAALQNATYGNTVRYLIDSTTTQAAGGPLIGSNDKITMMSSGNIYFNRSWTRSSTTLTVDSAAHGLSVGDGVLIRNASVVDDYNYYIVQSVSSDLFTVTVANSGLTSGTELSYIPAFSVSAWTSGTSITVSSPSAGNVQLSSLTINTTLNSTSFTVTVSGDGISNGGGSNSSPQTMNPPLVSAHNRTSGANLDASCTLDPTFPYNNFNIIGMNNVGTGDQTIMKLNF